MMLSDVCLSDVSRVHLDGGPVSEMTYTVSNGTLNPSIPYLVGGRHLRLTGWMAHTG